MKYSLIAELVLDTSKLTTAISAKIESTPDVDVIKRLKPLRVPWHLTADPTEQLGEDVELTLLFRGYKESGIGRELGEAALDNYIQTKTVLIRLGVSVTYSWVKH
ncbi:hypothetical protein SNOG_06926 [Parastagonospora nodorum SN15]|uniref:N-acetyltransferase domain-containing protein n=1 Tax=Phaeosphaeria nodorum (strain SN15 / ATCC MYA-4574 / FGSC 10173) TaxID=321614 RepID=Q0UMT8_PHANO|nr:hypothetical protein SNOG_06926 [Parastagonospora nodorum SN15]EAT85577.2 hypothetical protein SNOG_06926 [Parastagonospora nodorum SN15]